MMLLCTTVVVVLLTCPIATSFQDRDIFWQTETDDDHLLESEQFELRERRGFQLRRPCNQSQDCYPAKYQNTSIPPDFIECLDTMCVCRRCFMLLNDTCTDAPCHNYHIQSHHCEDLRKSQKTALLLSVFLSSIGAANFYIGRNGLGGGQLALFVVFLLTSCCLLCVPCCMFLCMDEDDFDETTESRCFICSMLLTMITTVVLMVTIACWWVADMVFFIHNGRDAGDDHHCPLLADL